MILPLQFLKNHHNAFDTLGIHSLRTAHDFSFELSNISFVTAFKANKSFDISKIRGEKTKNHAILVVSYVASTNLDHMPDIIGVLDR
jgi:hypothetical protein